MIKNGPMMILNEPGEINNNNANGQKTIGFELDLIGQPTYFSICVAQKQATLSDITPLARMLSTQLAIMVLDKLKNLFPAVTDAQLAAIT